EFRQGPDIVGNDDLDMRLETSEEQRQKPTEAAVQHAAALAFHAFGDQRHIAGELQRIAEPLLAPYEKRLAGQRFAFPQWLLDAAARLAAQFGGAFPARFVTDPALRVVPADELRHREVPAGPDVAWVDRQGPLEHRMRAVPALKFLEGETVIAVAQRIVRRLIDGPLESVDRALQLEDMAVGDAQ